MNNKSLALLEKIAAKKAAEQTRQTAVKEKYAKKSKKLTTDERLARIEELLGIE